MTSKEFVIWLKGFSKAANEYNITPAQWEIIVEELNKVEDKGYKVKMQDNPFWYSTSTITTEEDKTLLHD